MKRIAELEALKRQLEQSQKTSAQTEKNLAEKEKSRQRRSIGFHEEQKVRMQLEEEIEELQRSYDELNEKVAFLFLTFFSFNQHPVTLNFYS